MHELAWEENRFETLDCTKVPQYNSKSTPKGVETKDNVDLEVTIFQNLKHYIIIHTEKKSTTK